MFNTNLKIAWRNLLKDKQFTLLNVVGLSAGLTCALLICIWVNDEISVDKFNTNSSRLYQVMQNSDEDNGDVFTTVHTPNLLPKALEEELPEVESVAAIKFPDQDGKTKGIVTYSGMSFKARELYVTENFFDVFCYPLIAGNKHTVLADKSDVLLSDVMAMKLFQTTNVVGKTVEWSRGNTSRKGINGIYTVSGIFKVPTTSSQQFDVVFSYELYNSTTTREISWLSSDPSTYIILKKGVNAGQLNSKLKNFIKVKFKNGSQEQKWAGSLFIQPYTDTYLYNHYENGVVSGGRIEYVKLFSVTAIFILIIACINFMNLSTARSARRMKEVGVKKVVGATRTMLTWQFICESLLMAMVSLTVALFLVWILLPAFRQITGKELNPVMDAKAVLSVIAITIITGFIAGSYPALYLSKFKPVFVLKGKLLASAGESWVRKGLVVFQFAVSAILIITVIVVYKQMQLVQTKNLGYNKDNIIHFANEGSIGNNEQTFISELKKIPGVINATNMEGDMLGNHSGGGGITWPGKTERIEFGGLYTDFDFIETIGLKMKEGRSFSRDFPSDSGGVIFNETAIRMMHLKNPIGTPVDLWGLKQHIIGVVKDFNYESMYNTIGPFFICYAKNTTNIVVKIAAGTQKQTLAGIEGLYQKYNPGLPFNYSFIDEDYNAMYASEQRVSVLSGYFAGIAILISCLGLFGLAAFTAQRRQKEISIRKVVGASAGNIVTLLSKDFLVLVFIALAIAFPVAWWGVNNWLRSFAYRINISSLAFIITGVTVILITVITISFQSIKAAIANPVKSLRTE